MHKHEGIVVVAFKHGQPLSQLQADLELADIPEFITPMVHLGDREYGVATKVNRFDEADAVMTELREAGFQASMLQGPVSANGWRVL